MIRLATIDDAETIAAIHVYAWQAAYKGILSAQFLASLSIQERANMWRTVIAGHNGTVLLAVDRDREVGWIFFGPSRDEDGQEKAEIYAFYVLPQFWHQGIGRELLKEAERCLGVRQFKAITLWVLEKNRLAREFYEARGFRLDRIHKETRIGEALFIELRYEKRTPNLEPV